MRSVILLLLFSSVCFGQEVKVSEVTVIDGIVAPQLAGQYILADKTSKPTLSPGRYIEVSSDAANIEVEAVYSGKIVDAGQVNSNSFIIPSTQKMTLRIRCVDFDKKIYTKKVIELGGLDVDPDPVDPDPVDPVVPDKIDNLTVLIVYESALLPSYKKQHISVIQSTDLRTWMNSNTSLDAQKFPNWRVLDKDTKFPVNSDIVYSKWLKTPPSTLPYLIIGNKDTIVFQGPLPENVEEVKALITKYRK